MKELILIAVISIIVVTASFYTQVKLIIFPEKAISKNINLKVFAGSAYSSKIYAQCIAQISYTVTKSKGNKSSIILEKAYPDLHLVKYPTSTQAINQTINIPHVLDSQEQVIIYYTITYISKESTLTVRNGKFVSKGVLNDYLYIDI